MKSKRLEEMNEYILANGIVSLKDLENTFSISINTVRRDINTLVEQHLVKKVYGGVESLNIKDSREKLIDFEIRKNSNISAKKNIASVAATLINENDIIFIDSGTTTAQMVEYLPHDIKFTLITNNLEIILAMRYFSNVSLIIVGDTLDRRTMSFVYSIENQQHLSDLNIDKSFMAATAVSIENGLTNFSADEYSIKKRIVKNTKDIIVLADDSKINKSTLMTFIPLDQITTLITNENLNNEYMNFFKENNLKYLIAK